MILYLAGKISGDPEYRAKFRRAAEVMKERFVIDAILNPAELPEGMQPADYMRICLAMIDVADAAAFLEDWQESEGAKVEYAYCRYAKKEIYYISETIQEGGGTV